MNKQKVEKTQKQKLISDLISITFERERQRAMLSLAVFLPLFLQIYST